MRNRKSIFYCSSVATVWTATSHWTLTQMTLVLFAGTPGSIRKNWENSEIVL